jgi:hypothetical protein
MRRRSAYASTSSSGKSKETRRPAWPGLGEGVPVCRSCSALSRLRGYLSAGNLLRVIGLGLGLGLGLGFVPSRTYRATAASRAICQVRLAAPAQDKARTCE